MNKSLSGVWAVLAWPALALAQSAPSHPAQAADPAASVPSPVYRSAFEPLPRGVVDDSVDWTTANADVGQFKRGHSDILRWEKAHDKANAEPATPTLPKEGAR